MICYVSIALGFHFLTSAGVQAMSFHTCSRVASVFKLSEASEIGETWTPFTNPVDNKQDRNRRREIISDAASRYECLV